jgi:hypothetical protein
MWLGEERFARADLLRKASFGTQGNGSYLFSLLVVMLAGFVGMIAVRLPFREPVRWSRAILAALPVLLFFHAWVLLYSGWSIRLAGIWSVFWFDAPRPQGLLAVFVGCALGAVPGRFGARSRPGTSVPAE